MKKQSTPRPTPPKPPSSLGPTVVPGYDAELWALRAVEMAFLDMNLVLTAEDKPDTDKVKLCKEIALEALRKLHPDKAA